MAKSPHTKAGKQTAPERASGRHSGVGKAPDAPVQRTADPAFQGGRIDSRALTPQSILTLQRTIGNHGVNQLLKQPETAGRALIPRIDRVPVAVEAQPRPGPAMPVQRERGAVTLPRDGGMVFPYSIASLTLYFTTHIQPQILEVQNEASAELRAAEAYLRETEIPYRQGLYDAALLELQQAILTEAGLLAGQPVPVRAIAKVEFDLQANPVAQKYRKLQIAIGNLVNKLNTSYTDTYKPTKDVSKKEETADAASLKDQMGLEYDDEHGKLHFIAKPTKKKTAWDLNKSDANALCEKAIKAHMDTLLAGSSAKGWTVWYITEDNGKAVGRYSDPGVRNGSPTSQFSIQLQVSLEDKHISYHGYPDEKALKTGVGKGRNLVD